MKILVLYWAVLSSIGILTCTAQNCGQQQLQNRIVGGFDAEEGAWPWQVDIQIRGTGHVCGGTIIAEEWVLSAAHCFPDPNDVSSYTIYAGRHQLNGWNPFESSHRIRRVVIPPEYSDPQEGDDIALVQLDTGVIFSDRIQPICLPNDDTFFDPGTRCTITGWGNIRDGVTLQGVGTLQQVIVPIISQSSCQSMYNINSNPNDPVNIMSDMICAGYQEGGKDSCQGDSGGPLVCPMVNGAWVQVGIVSFGLGCAQANRPGVYSKVSSFNRFIKSNIPQLQLFSSAGRIQRAVTTMLPSILTLLMVAHILR
ncbi:serine protease 33 [Alosa sapidissima]|uniref:serine protease 33 n=1 Tax=Alosa sapidissima TaxID=34773 RepID=UPI001C090330|nr:serine protease 33 [Alosa sapidissima]